MTRNKYIFIFGILTLFFTECGKDEDTTIKKTISGNVMNMCTGKGFANVEVKFVTDQKKGRFINSAYYESWVSTMTDSSGNFIFSNMDIHSSDKYKYGITIENKGDYLAEQYGHSGISYELNKDEISDFQKIRLSASFKLCRIKYPDGISIIAAPDTFSLKFEQKIFHKYMPENIYQLFVYPRFINTGPLFSPNWGGVPYGHMAYNP